MDSRDIRTLHDKYVVTYTKDDVPHYLEQCPVAVVPNASLSPRETFAMYQRGIDVPRLGGAVREACNHDGYYPTDPMEALQLANEFASKMQRLAETPPLPSHGETPSSDTDGN